MITKLKVQIEEDKRIDEALKEKLEEKDSIIGNLGAKIVALRKDIQNKNMQNSSIVMDDIINSQKFHLDKSRLGYNQTEKGSSSKTTDQETQPISFTRKITKTLLHPEDSDFIISDSRKQEGLKKKKGS